MLRVVSQPFSALQAPTATDAPSVFESAPTERQVLEMTDLGVAEKVVTVEIKQMPT